MNKEQPLVSVVMPAYNSEATIGAALRSALSQEGANIEVVVVDDGSADLTARQARQFGERVRVIEQSNAGPQVARNRGIQEAKGEYIAFLDADDIWLPGKVSAQLKVLQSDPGVVATFTRWHVWEPDESGAYSTPEDIVNRCVDDCIDPAMSGWLYTTLLFDCVMLTTTVMLRARTLAEIGTFDATLRVGEDYDLWLRLSQAGRIVKLASVGALYRILPGSASRHPHKLNHEHFVVSRAIERWGATGPDGSVADTKRLAERLRRLELDHAGLHLARGDGQVALAGYGRALRNQPLRLRLWLNALRSLVKAQRH